MTLGLLVTAKPLHQQGMVRLVGLTGGGSPVCLDCLGAGGRRRDQRFRPLGPIEADQDKSLGHLASGTLASGQPFSQ